MCVNYEQNILTSLSNLRQGGGGKIQGQSQFQDQLWFFNR